MRLRCRLFGLWQRDAANEMPASAGFFIAQWGDKHYRLSNPDTTAHRRGAFFVGALSLDGYNDCKIRAL